MTMRTPKGSAQPPWSRRLCWLTAWSPERRARSVGPTGEEPFRTSWIRIVGPLIHPGLMDRLGRPSQEMMTGPGMTVSVVSSVADWTLASVTFTVKLDVPSAVGVPDSAPVDAFSVIPAGRLPLLTDQVYGPVPPETASVAT